MSLVSRAVRDYTDLTRRLADLVVGFGANVQPGQLVGITSYLGKEDLTREIARAAYERGARYVDVLYSDPWVKRERLLHGDPETLSYIPPWMIERLRHFSDEHAARISLSGPAAPHALDGIAADRSGLDLLPYLPETGEIVNRAHDELVRRAGADPGLGGGRVPRTSTRTRPTTASGARSPTSAGSTPTTPSPPGPSAWRRSSAARPP